MNITSEQIKDLREKTGISVMQCKKALEEAEGDQEKAIAILKEKSSEQMAKKADREFGAGVVEAYIHSNGLMGSLIELSSETDFVSNNAEFRTLAKDIAMQVTAGSPEFLRESDMTDEDKKNAEEAIKEDSSNMETYIKEKVLLNQDFIKNPEMTIQGMLDAAMQKFGERIEVTKFKRFEIGR
jgi:elongation factor Ts